MLVHEVEVHAGEPAEAFESGKWARALGHVWQGAAASVAAELVVYPMEVVRRRMQIQAASVGGAGETATRRIIF